MAHHMFDRGGADDGALMVSIDSFYGENYVCTEIEPGGLGFFNLTAEQARAYAADLLAHAEALEVGGRS